MANLTLEDVAREAGVSRSTVSRVVNDHPNVSDDVRQRVLAVIENIGYHPNVAARMLASQRSWMIGLVLPLSVSLLFTDPYYAILTQGIAQGCNQYDYTMSLFMAGSKDDECKILPKITRKGILDGVIIQAGHRGDVLLERLVNSDMPVVVAGRPFHAEGVSYIDIDNVNAAYNAVSHLVRLGRQRVGMISGPISSTVGVDRREGYMRALKERGHAVDEVLIVEGDFTEEGGYYAMQKLLDSHPDAIFAASDIMALGAMRAVRDVGLNIPDDIAFVGFDDMPIATPIEPPLTTVRQPITEFGIQAVEILIDLIENGVDPPRRVVMNTKLIIRASCGAHWRG